MKAYEITCFEVGIIHQTFLAASESEAIALFKSTYPRANKVWADEIELREESEPTDAELLEQRSLDKFEYRRCEGEA